MIFISLKNFPWNQFNEIFRENDFTEKNLTAYIPTSKTTNTPPILTSPRALAVATLPLPDRRVLQSSESDLKKCKQRADNIYMLKRLCKYDIF